MLNDLSDIEDKGYKNPHTGDGSSPDPPPLSLSMIITKDPKQDLNTKRHLFFSLHCPALEPGDSKNNNNNNNDESKMDNINGRLKMEKRSSLYTLDDYLKISDNISASANEDDYSAIVMTCTALTSRAEGSFFISRSKVEFSIVCAGRTKVDAYEYDMKRNDVMDFHRQVKEPSVTQSQGRCVCVYVCMNVCMYSCMCGYVCACVSVSMYEFIAFSFDLFYFSLSYFYEKKP